MQLRKKAVTLVGVLAVLAGSVIPAQAADPSDAVVTGAADLAITNPAAGDFAVLLDGTAKTAYSTLGNFDATDARGTGAGWRVTVQATQFKEWGDIDGTGPGTDIGYVTSGKDLALNSLSLAPLTVAKKDTSSSAEPTISMTAATAVDATSAVQIATATGPAGMGSYTFTQGTHAGQTGQAFKLSVPASAYAKTYRSNVTVSIVSGP